MPQAWGVPGSLVEGSDFVAHERFLRWPHPVTEPRVTPQPRQIILKEGVVEAWIDLQIL